MSTQTQTPARPAVDLVREISRGIAVPPVTLRLSSRQLRCLVRDAVPMDFGRLDDEPFRECEHDDGMLWHQVDSAFDSFSLCVPLREFLAARFGVHQVAIALDWSPYEWRYSASVYGAIVTPAERQRLAEYED